MNNNLTSNEYIPLNEAKRSIIAALSEFHPDLGTKAAEILHNEERLKIREIAQDEPNKTDMQSCTPAGMTEKWLDQNGMLLDNYDDIYLKYFGEQVPDNDQAVIRYEYDGTPRSVVYLAHELGHAIADDIQNKDGLSFKDFSPDQMEEQAYFVQNIYTHYTGNQSPESSGRASSLSREFQYKSAGVAFEKGLTMNAEQRRNLMVEALGGKVNANAEHVEPQPPEVTSYQAPRPI